MSYLIVVCLFCSVTVFIISKSSIVQILSMKFAADSALFLFYGISRAQPELRSLGWMLFSLIMITIFLMAMASLTKAVHRGLNE